MPDPGTASQPAQAPTAGATSRLASLRRETLGMALMVLVQYALGMWVNLFATIPSADHGAELVTAIGLALAYGPAMLATHATVGLLILLGTIGMTYHAVTLRRPPLIAAASVALLAVLSAVGGGAGFVGTQQDSMSYDMAISAGVALACFVVILYLTGKPQIEAENNEHSPGQPVTSSATANGSAAPGVDGPHRQP